MQKDDREGRLVRGRNVTRKKLGAKRSVRAEEIQREMEQKKRDERKLPWGAEEMRERTAKK